MNRLSDQGQHDVVWPRVFIEFQTAAFSGEGPSPTIERLIKQVVAVGAIQDDVFAWQQGRYYDGDDEEDGGQKRGWAPQEEGWPHCRVRASVRSCDRST